MEKFVTDGGDVIVSESCGCKAGVKKFRSCEAHSILPRTVEVVASEQAIDEYHERAARFLAEAKREQDKYDTGVVDA